MVIICACSFTDVIGIIPKTDKIKDFNNRHGKPQKNIKFKLSDGR